MGEVVGAIGVPHTPRFPITAQEDSPAGEDLRRLYGAVASQLESLEPDVVVICSTDHFNTYFADLPVFAIGCAESTYGPMDNADIPPRRLDVDASLAWSLYQHAVSSGFDLCLSQEFRLDHSFVVPYHFLAASLGLPIIPVFVSGLAGALPSAKRCAALGAILREGIEAASDHKRVALIASGSFSLDLGGAAEGVGGNNGGVPDSAWTDRVVSLLAKRELTGLVEEATPEQLVKAGNIGGEILNWITVAGALRGEAPTFLERHEPFGHAFCAWSGGEV